MKQLRPGLYVERVDYFPVKHGEIVRGCPSCRGCVDELAVTTFDLRMVSANSELQKPLPAAVLHTFEHLGNEFLRRNMVWQKHLVAFGPRGSRTGCKLVLMGDLTPHLVVYPSFRMSTVRELVLELCWSIMSWTSSIPAATKDECASYLDHNLLAARAAAHNYYAVLSQSREELGYDQFEYPV